VKKHRTRETGYDNDHERDAIAAALGAYDAHADQFDRVAAKVPPRQDLGAVIERVVADEQSVESVLADLADDEDDEETEAESVDNEPTPEQRRIRQLEGQVEQLQEHVERLEAQVEERDERIAEYEEELSEAKREERREARERREVTRLERENRRLERELDEERDRVEALEGKLERLKELWKLDHSDFADVSEKRAGLVPVKVIDQFTTDDIEAAHEQFGLAEDDVVLLRDASGAGWSSAERLAEVNPRVVLRNGQLSDMADRVLFDHDVPVAPAELVTVQEVDELAVARESEVEDAIADWEDRASERERQQSAEMVDRLISEHRADRAE
jgi:predicted RNase H-like nuclease (RuvC/YqgF family)